MAGLFVAWVYKAAFSFLRVIVETIIYRPLSGHVDGPLHLSYESIGVIALPYQQHIISVPYGFNPAPAQVINHPFASESREKFVY